MDDAASNALPVIDGCFCAEPEFFMIWTKRGRKPGFVHSNRLSAETEAIRLAKKHPGQKFIVLAATRKFWVNAPPPPVPGFTTAGDALPAATLAQVGAAA